MNNLQDKTYNEMTMDLSKKYQIPAWLTLVAHEAFCGKENGFSQLMPRTEATSLADWLIQAKNLFDDKDEALEQFAEKEDSLQLEITNKLLNAGRTASQVVTVLQNSFGLDSLEAHNLIIKVTIENESKAKSD